MDSALKAFSSFFRDPKIRFTERRLFIQVQLPTQSGHDAQKCIESLNDDLTTLRNEIAECQTTILQLRKGKDPESARRKFGVLCP